MSNSSRSADGAIRAVIFDYGEVLSHPPDPEAIAGMARVLGMDVERFRQLYGAHRYKYDRGDYLPEQYWTAVAQDAAVPVTPGQIDQLRHADVQMWSSLNTPMLSWAGELRKSGFRTAVLSNMHIDMVHFARSQFEWLANFDCMVLSSELRMAKPDAEIFRHCLERLQVQASEALFIDDREPNVTAARSVGLQAICANSPEAVRRQLQETGWSGPLPA